MQETTQREQCSESREQKDGRRGGKPQTEGKTKRNASTLGRRDQTPSSA